MEPLRKSETCETSPPSQPFDSSSQGLRYEKRFLNDSRLLSPTSETTSRFSTQFPICECSQDGPSIASLESLGGITTIEFNLVKGPAAALKIKELLYCPLPGRDSLLQALLLLRDTCQPLFDTSAFTVAWVLGMLLLLDSSYSIFSGDERESITGNRSPCASKVVI